MNLLIDTVQKGLLKLELQAGGKTVAKLEKNTDELSEEFLPEIQKFLRKQKVEPQDLSKIFVNPGPGGFSSTRTGVAVANALAFALNIPLVDSKSGKVKEVVLPKYEKEPNITHPATRHFTSRSGNK